MIGGFFLALLIVLAAYILIKGAMGFKPSYLSFTSEGIGNQFFNTLYLVVLSLIISVVNLFVGIFGGNFSIQSLIEIVPPALMFWCAGNVKKQA